MKIIVDAFGGDRAPGEILLGCAQAREEYGMDLVLAGDRAKIETAAKELNIETAVGGMEILDAPDVLTMEDEPGSVLKAKSGSSMAVGLRALAEGRGDAFASAGNSGALVVGATLIVKRIKGVRRVSFAPIMPKQQGFFMLNDGGANAECTPEMLLQFGLMGSAYMQQVMGVSQPRVGLCNVGTESHKGDGLRQEAYRLLSTAGGIRFVGNVEPRDLPFDACDVAVADGFTGNMLLKMYEGTALAMLGMVKDVFGKNLKTKLGAALVYSDLKQMKKQVDYNEYGGAPVMGCSKPVFKIHGSAKAATVKNALRLTRDYVQSGFTETVAQTVKAAKGKD